MPVARQLLEDETIAGDPSDFAIGYAFIGDDRTTEISMFVKGGNILGFTSGGAHRTTRWPYLEGLVAWLARFSSSMVDDPYPMAVDGEFAAQKDQNARTFESDDIDAMDAYYGPLNDWTYRHTWHSESGGAILANVYFEYRSGLVELSWDNQGLGDEAVFDYDLGGARIDAETFRAVVREFVHEYERHWGIRVDDETTWLRKG